MREMDTLSETRPVNSMFTKRVLVVKLSSLGDLFHMLPAVHVLRRELDATVDWVTQPEYAGLVACFSDVRRVLCFPRRNFLQKTGAFIRDLRGEEYGLIIDGQGLLKSALTARIARGGVRVGPMYCREGAGLLYAIRPPRAVPRGHAVEEALDLVRYLGLTVEQTVFPVRFPVTALPGSGPRIGLVSGSRWPSKNWPPDCFGRLAEGLHRRLGATLFLLDDRRNESMSRVVRGSLPSEALHDLSGTLDLPHLGGVLQALDLVITNDTGPMHMAAAVETPVVALFGPTDPTRTGPWGSGHCVLRAEDQPACAPCFRKNCRQGQGACMRGIPVETVVSAAESVLRAQ